MNSLNMASTLVVRKCQSAPAAIRSFSSSSRWFASAASVTARTHPHYPSILVSRKVDKEFLNRCTAYNGCGHFPPISSVRYAHTDAGDGERSSRTLPALMDFPPVMWPGIVHTIRNWFFTHFVIRPFFDKEFSVEEFMKGAHEAVTLVSTKMSTGELDDLEGLVDPAALKELKVKMSTFSVFQRDLLRVAAEDIFFSFPYQIGIIIPENPFGQPQASIEEGVKPPPQTRHVEITVVLHVLRGMAEMQRKGETGPQFNLTEFAKDDNNKHRVMVCNYRFFRDFTEGCKDPSWIVNMVNHFLPADHGRLGLGSK